MNRSGIHRRRSIALTVAAGFALFTAALSSAEVGNHARGRGHAVRAQERR